MANSHLAAKLLAVFFAVCAISFALEASAQHGDWPRGGNDCIMSKKQRESHSQRSKAIRNCYRYGIIRLSTPDRSGYELVRRHGRLFVEDDEKVKFIKSLGFEYDAERQERNFDNIEAHGLTKAIRQTSSKKKHPKEKWIHRPVYDLLYPISTEKAIVRLFDGSWQIATARSKKYDPIPFTMLSIHRHHKYLPRGSDADWQAFIFSATRKGEGGAQDLQLIRPDMTLGAVLSNVAANQRDKILFQGDEILVKQRNPSTGAITVSTYPIEDLYQADKVLEPQSTGMAVATLNFDTEHCGPDGCSPSEYRTNGNFAVLGDLPEDTGLYQHAELKKLYWPMLEDGTMLDKPDHILGLVPFRFSKWLRENKTKRFNSMIAVIQYEPGSGYDYMVLGGAGLKTDPHVATPVLRQLDDNPYLMDDLRIEAKNQDHYALVFQSSDWGDWYAIDDNVVRYGGQNFRQMESFKNKGFVITNDTYFGNLTAADTPEDALNQAKTIITRSRAFEDEKYKRRRDDIDLAVATLSSVSNGDLVSDVQDCRAIYNATNSLGRDDSAARLWQSTYELYPDEACKNIPRTTHQAALRYILDQYPTYDYDAPDPFDMDAAMREFTRQNDDRIKSIRNESCIMNPDGKTKTCTSGN